MATSAPALVMRVVLAAVGVVAAAAVEGVVATPPTVVAGGRVLVAVEAPRPTRAADALPGRSPCSEVPAGDVAPLLRLLQRSVLPLTMTARSHPRVRLRA